MKRARKNNQKETGEEIPLKQTKTEEFVPPQLETNKPQYKEVIGIKKTYVARVSITRTLQYSSLDHLKNITPVFVPDPKRQLIYTQNFCLDKLAVINLKTCKVIKNIGPTNPYVRDGMLERRRLVYCYRFIRFLNDNTLLAMRYIGQNLEHLLVRVDLKTFKYEDIDIYNKVPELKNAIITDYQSVPEKSAIAVAAELRKILLIDLDKGLIKTYKHNNDLIFGVSYHPKRKWIVAESRMTNPRFQVFDMESGQILKVVDLRNQEGLSGIYQQNPSCLLDYLIMLINYPRLVKIHEDGTLEALEQDLLLNPFSQEARLFKFCADEQTRNIFCADFSDILKVYDNNFNLSFVSSPSTSCASVCLIDSPSMLMYYNYKRRVIEFCRVIYKDESYNLNGEKSRGKAK